MKAFISRCMHSSRDACIHLEMHAFIDDVQQATGKKARGQTPTGIGLDGHLRDRLGIVGIAVLDHGTCLKYVCRAGSQTRNNNGGLDVRQRLHGPGRRCTASCRNWSPPELVTGGVAEFHEPYEHLPRNRTRVQSCVPTPIPVESWTL